MWKGDEAMLRNSEIWQKSLPLHDSNISIWSNTTEPYWVRVGKNDRLEPAVAQGFAGLALGFLICMDRDTPFSLPNLSEWS